MHSQARRRVGCLMLDSLVHPCNEASSKVCALVSNLSEVSASCQPCSHCEHASGSAQ